MFVSVKINRKALFLVIGAVAAGLSALIINSAVKAYAKENPKGSVKVPIIKYENVCRDESQCGENDITSVKLEEDILWLKENGYTPVFVNDLVLFVNGQEELPEKPVVLTFDEGQYNMYSYVMPLLEKYKFKAAISVAGEYADEASEGAKPQADSSYLRWKEIDSMRKSGLVEFANMTYGLADDNSRQGLQQAEGESYEDFRSVVLKDVDKLQQLFESHCKFRSNVFTFPNGKTCENGQRIIKNMGFCASLCYGEKVNIIKKQDKSCLYNLYRFSRNANMTSAEFFEKQLDL